MIPRNSVFPPVLQIMSQQKECLSRIDVFPSLPPANPYLTVFALFLPFHRASRNIASFPRTGFVSFFEWCLPSLRCITPSQFVFPSFDAFPWVNNKKPSSSPPKLKSPSTPSDHNSCQAPGHPTPQSFPPYSAVFGGLL